ncbi:MAG: nicotinamide-nucleotide adenylyltransferase [Candidatus Bathyarchaeia archaeon]
MKKKNLVGLYVGRFQPPHNGHVYAIMNLLNKVNELIIGLGSAQHSHEINNPFTTSERFTMLRLALDEARVDRRRYMIIPLPDTDMHSLWVAQLLAYAPEFDVAFSNEALTSRLLKERNFKVLSIPFLERKKYHATTIREKMLSDNSWEELVPRSVAAHIKRIGGVERIRDLNRTDKPKLP